MAGGIANTGGRVNGLSLKGTLAESCPSLGWEELELMSQKISIREQILLLKDSFLNNLHGM